MTYRDAKRLMKSALAALLAADLVKRYPKCYAGHEGDALIMISGAYPTKKDMLLAGSVTGLWNYAWED